MIEIKCAKCQRVLRIVEGEVTESVFIEPCQNCLNAQYEAGYDDGLHDTCDDDSYLEEDDDWDDDSWIEDDWDGDE